MPFLPYVIHCHPTSPARMREAAVRHRGRPTLLFLRAFLTAEDSHQKPKQEGTDKNCVWTQVQPELESFLSFRPAAQHEPKALRQGPAATPSPATGEDIWDARGGEPPSASLRPHLQTSASFIFLQYFSKRVRNPFLHFQPYNSFHTSSYS